MGINVSSGLCQLWDLMQSKMITEFRSHTAAVNIIQFHPNEYLLASGSSDRYDTTPEPALHGPSERQYCVFTVSQWQDPEALWLSVHQHCHNFSSKSEAGSVILLPALIWRITFQTASLASPVWWSPAADCYWRKLMLASFLFRDCNWCVCDESSQTEFLSVVVCCWTTEAAVQTLFLLIIWSRCNSQTVAEPSERSLYGFMTITSERHILEGVIIMKH